MATSVTFNLSYLSTRCLLLLLLMLAGGCGSSKSRPQYDVTGRRGRQTGEKLVSVPPAPTATTLTLDLDHNAIYTLANDSLATVAMVRVISLRHNGLTVIEAGAFRDLAALTEVHLSHNSLTSLPDRLFSTNQRLQVVSVRGNALHSVPNTAFHTLTSLTHLDLAHNRLTTATLGAALRHATRLRTLDLSSNNIATIEKDAFMVTSEWVMSQGEGRLLNLSRCGVRHIEPGAFSHLTFVSVLDLSANDALSTGDLVSALRDLDVTSLRSLNLRDVNMTSDTVGRLFRREQWHTLRDLNLAHNAISSVPHGAFHSLVNLRGLDLSHNSLEQPGDLDDLGRLERLSLAHNRLVTLTEVDFDGLHALRMLDLSHNAIGQLTSEPFQHLFDLDTLVLSNNRISTVTLTTGLETLQSIHLANNYITSDVNFVRGLKSLRHLDMSNNLLTSLEAGWFTEAQSLAVANFSSNSITRISSEAFGGASVTSLDLSHNDLGTLSDVTWPGGLASLNVANNHVTNISARCLLGLYHVTELDLSSNRLTSLPRDMARYLPSVSRLDLSDNDLGRYLSHVTVSPLSVMASLQWLVLSDNHVTALPATLLSSHAAPAMSRLQRLDLSHNLLQSLPGHVLSQLPELQYVDVSSNRLTHVDPGVLSGMDSLRVVDLSLNPWSCDCDLAQLQAWLVSPDTSHRVTVAHLHTPGAYTCHTPASLRDTSITAWAGPDCSHAPPPLSIILLLVGACVVIVLVTLGIGLLCHVMCVRQRHQGCHDDHEEAKYSTIMDSPPCLLHNTRLWL